MKKCSVLLAVSIFMAAIGCSVFFGCKEKKGTIKIGAIMTLSGNVSYWPSQLKKGMDMAFSERDSTKEHVQLLYEDDAFKPNLAIASYNKLTKVDAVDVIISAFAPIANALIPLAEKDSIPLIASIAASSDIAKGYRWIFRDYITQQQQCPLLAEYVYNKLNLKKGSYLVINDDFGRDGIIQFNQKLVELGGEPITGEHISQTENTSRNEILKILKQSPDYIYVIARDQLLISICNQIREMDKEIQIVGLNPFDTDVLWNAIGMNGEGIYFTSSYFSLDENEESKKFFNSYKERYNEEPNYTSIYGYTMMKYLLDIAKNAKNKADIRNKLELLNTQSIRGNLVTNSNHDIISPIGLYKRENGKTMLITHK